MGRKGRCCHLIGIIERGKLLFNGDVDQAIRQVRTKRVYIVSVGQEQNELGAKKCETFVEVELVEMLKEAKRRGLNIQTKLD